MEIRLGSWAAMCICTIMFAVGGCATTSVIGYDRMTNNVYHGKVTMSFWDGTGSVVARSDESGLVANGVAMYSYGSPDNRGGTVKMQMSDGRILVGEWMTMGLTKGTGSATDGNSVFVFQFGFSPQEESDFIINQRKLNAPARPSVGQSYNPLIDLDRLFKALPDPKTADEIAFRNWFDCVIQSAEHAYEKYPQAETSKLIWIGTVDAEPMEKHLRDILIAEHYPDDAITQWLEKEKLEMPQALQKTIDSRKNKPAFGHGA